jgi:hypothetical protein
VPYQHNLGCAFGGLVVRVHGEIITRSALSASNSAEQNGRPSVARVT